MGTYEYTPFIQHGTDETEYRLLSKDHVRVEMFNGKEMLIVDQKAIELLTYEAFTDVNFYLRKKHTAQVAKILDDPEASENDRFVANAFLENAIISAKGELPYCQDTGTAIVNGYKGSDVITDGDDKVTLSRAEGERTVPLVDLYSTIGELPLATSPDELLAEIHVPIPPEDSGSAYHRLSFRNAIDYPIASAGVYVETENGKIKKARIVVGAISRAPLLLAQPGKNLEGCDITDLEKIKQKFLPKN